MNDRFRKRASKEIDNELIMLLPISMSRSFGCSSGIVFSSNSQSSGGLGMGTSNEFPKTMANKKMFDLMKPEETV